MKSRGHGPEIKGKSSQILSNDQFSAEGSIELEANVLSNVFFICFQEPFFIKFEIWDFDTFRSF